MPHALSGDQSAASRWIGYARFLLTRGEEARSLALAFPSPDHVLEAAETPMLRLWRRDVLASVDKAALLPPASWALPISDEDYSPLLAECSDAPCLLFGRGDPSVLTKPAIAIVGSRQPSLDGCSLAEHFGHDLARAGFVIVSGLASGIDTAAHRGAIKAGGQTIAVVATGIDTTYPRSNRSLCEESLKMALLSVSSYQRVRRKSTISPVGTEPCPVCHSRQLLLKRVCPAVRSLQRLLLSKVGMSLHCPGLLIIGVVGVVLSC